MTVINSNISALKAQASGAQNSRKLDSAMERLSTGARINSAKDDAAGLGIANKMTAQINGLNQAIRNANDGLSMVNTIEASLQQTTSVLQRIRELAVQSANDSNSVEDRQFLQSEIVQMQAELDRIAGQGRYNGMKVLDGTFTNKQIQIGANGYETLSFNVDAASSADIGAHQKRLGTMGAVAADTDLTSAGSPVTASTMTVSGYLGTETVSISADNTAKAAAYAVNNKSADTGVSALAVTKAKISTFSAAGTVTFDVTGKNSSAVTVSATLSSTSDLTALSNAFNLVSAQTGITSELSADKSYIILTSADGYDIGLADHTNSAGTTSTVAVQGMKGDGSTTVGTSRTVTGTASLDSTRIVGDLLFSSSKAFTLKDSAGATGTDAFAGTTAQSSALAAMSTVDVSTAAGAAAAIDIVDGAIAKVSNMRADLGAVASRLEKTVDALTAASTNVSAARSRIQDADYSVETTNLSKAQIIAQASTAMLAQANQQASIVLSLLK
jgi:flagellin